MPAKKTETEPSIVLRSPFSEAFESLQHQIRERAYHIFLDREPAAGDAQADWLSAQAELLHPFELTIKEQKKKLVAECDLKGFSPEEIEIEVEDGVLKAFGRHEEQRTNRKGNTGTETSSAAIYFYQTAKLPSRVDLNQCTAKLFKNGKLKVTLPKLDED